MYNECRNVTLTFTVSSVFSVFHYSSQRSSLLGSSYQFLSLPLPQCWLGSSYQHKKESAQNTRLPCSHVLLTIFHCAHILCQNIWVCSSLSVITSYESLWYVPVNKSHKICPSALKIKQHKIFFQWTSKSSSHKSQQIMLFV